MALSPSLPSKEKRIVSYWTLRLSYLQLEFLFVSTKKFVCSGSSIITAGLATARVIEGEDVSTDKSKLPFSESEQETKNLKTY